MFNDCQVKWLSHTRAGSCLLPQYHVIVLFLFILCRLACDAQFLTGSALIWNSYLNHCSQFFLTHLYNLFSPSLPLCLFSASAVCVCVFSLLCGSGYWAHLHDCAASALTTEPSHQTDFTPLSPPSENLNDISQKQKQYSHLCILRPYS